MQRLLLLILGVMLVATSVAQEETDTATDDAESEELVQTDENEADEPIVDDEFYQDVDDEDFRPSEDIPADQSIPFPTDI